MIKRYSIENMVDNLDVTTSDAQTHVQEARKTIRAIPDEAMRVYRVSNITIPMAPPATDIPITQIMFSKLAKREWSADEYAQSRLDDAQVTDIGRVTSRVHTEKSVPFIVQGFESTVKPEDLELSSVTSLVTLVDCQRSLRFREAR